MADNAGKPGDAPTSGDAARQSVRTYDRGSLSRPPPAQRRDPRADPDDEPISERVDVVTMDRGSGDRNSTIDSLTNAALTLRRELAKLHQQAAAVERTIEDQRRERNDAMERTEQVNARAGELQQRAEAAEAEVANLKRLHDQVKLERDELAHALEQAKATTEELQRTRDELAAVRREKDDVVRAAGTIENELAEIRKREQLGAQKATDTEGELQAVRERFERTSAELLSAREEVTAAKAETVKFRQEAQDAAEVAAQKLSESEHERLAAKEQVSRLEQQLADMRVVQEKVVALDADLTNARMELVNGRSEIGRLERDVEDGRHARDVANERATMAEKETADIRKEVERLQQSLDAANQTAANASARAVAAERARVASEESVRSLRDEITSAFARWRSATPSVAPPPNSVAPPTRAVPLNEVGLIPGTAPLPRELSAPPNAEPMKVQPSSAQTAPPSAHVPEPITAPVVVSGPPPPPPPPPPPSAPMLVAPPDAETRPVLDDEWGTASKPPPPPSPPPPPPSGSSRASKAPSGSKLPSVAPPPASASMRASKPPSARLKSVPPAAPEPPPQPVRAASIPPMHPRSVVPAPPVSARPSAVPVSSRSVPPPLPPRAQSIPPAIYPSVPPASAVAPLPLSPGSTSPTLPPPRPEESSVVTYVSQERANYIELLGSPSTSREAALALREHPDWLRGRPPIELLLALTLLDYDIEDPVFELARAWDRDPLCRALIAALRDEPDSKLREHASWLLKHLGSAGSWPAIAELVSNEEEAPAVRRWLLEAIERLVGTRAIGWTEVGDLCQRLVKHGNPSLRDGTVGVVAALDRSDDKRRLLLEVLRTDHDEVVLASAVQALTTALPIELDPSVAERLLGHPSARVQQSVVEFIERSKRAAKNA